MEALIDAVFSEEAACLLIVIGVVFGPGISTAVRHRHERKREVAQQQFKLERDRIALERSQLEAKRPICLCGHGANYHDRTGGCTARVQVACAWHPETGAATDYADATCDCVDYTGPTPGITGSVLGELGERP